jgi:hypothetical protein
MNPEEDRDVYAFWSDDTIYKVEYNSATTTIDIV